MQKFLFSVPITKRDDDKWEVEGVATSETLDKQGEIVDYAAAKKFFEDETLWPGNIRQQHNPDKPVGKRVSVSFDDTAKAITLRARISKGAADTWEMVKDGTLSMFSIGGAGTHTTEKLGDRDVTRVFLKSLIEVSLVDNGANPDSAFSMIKSVDGVLVDEQPAEDDKASATLDAALKAAGKAVPKKGDKKDDTDDEGDDAKDDKKKKFASVDGKSIEIAGAGDVRKALVALLTVPATERAAVKANIITIATAQKLVDELPEAWKPADVQDKTKLALPVRRVVAIGEGYAARITKALGDAGKDRVAAVTKAGMEPWDVDAALGILSGIEHLMSSEYWEARCAAMDGNTDSVEVAQVAMLKQAAELLMQWLVSEFAEQFAASVNYDGTTIDLGLSGDAVVEMFAKMVTVVQKAGARHSKGDVEMIQKAHDLMNGLGANCALDDVDKALIKVIALDTVDAYTVALHVGDKVLVDKMDVVDKDGKAVTKLIAAPAIEGDTISKLTGELETSKANAVEQTTKVTKLTEALADVTKRLEAIESSPAAVGPVKSAAALQVDKSIGGPSGQQAQTEGGDLTELLKGCSEDTRRDVAAQMVKRAQGGGAQ